MASTDWTKRVRTKTYSLGLYLVGGVILLQVAAVISVFWLRHAIKVDLEAPRLRVSATEVIPSTPPDPGFVAPVLPPPEPAPAPASPPPGQPLLQPQISARLNVALVLDPQERIAALQQEARKFIQAGDYDLARAALLEAENLDPRRPSTLLAGAELAELEKDTVRAKLYWQKLLTLGPEIGESYLRAQQRLAGFNPAAPVADKTLVASFSLDTIQQLAVVENETSQEFTLRIPIRLLVPQAVVNTTEMNIKLFFYDENDAKDIVPTVAERRISWSNALPTWEKSPVEELVATYRLKRSPAGRKFYGYVFKLYYQGKLQEERASPSRLLAMFPATKGVLP